MFVGHFLFLIAIVSVVVFPGRGVPAVSWRL